MSDNIDKAAHDLMSFKPQKVTRVHGYEVFYHEERLYTVRDSNTGITSLVYAREPREAVEKVAKMTAELPMSAVEFGKTRERLCRTCSCSSCPLMNIYTGCKYHEINDDTVAIVEKWAKEHPEEADNANS